MNLRLLVCGALGGLLAALTLSLPLYVVLPTRYAGDWLAPLPNPGWVGWEALGFGLSVLVALLTGYTAARWGWASSTAERVKLGAWAGLLACFVAFALVGAAAAGVAGNDMLYSHGPVKPTTQREFIEIVCDSVVGCAWMPYLAFWAMALGATVLGALGGWLSGFAVVPRWGEHPPAIAAEPIDAGIAILIMQALELMTIVTAISTLRTNAEAKATFYSLQLRFPTSGIIGWPIAMCMLPLIAATWYCGQWCWRRWHHPVAGLRRVARLAGGILIATPIVVGFFIYQNRLQLYAEWFFLVPAGLWFALTLFWMFRFRFVKAGPTVEPAPLRPALWGRLLINAGFLALVLPGLVMLSGVAVALSLALGIVTYIDVLTPGSATEVASRSISRSMLDIYVIHFMASVYIAAAWGAFATVHAWLVFAAQRGIQKVTGTEPESRDPWGAALPVAQEFETPTRLVP